MAQGQLLGLRRTKAESTKDTRKGGAEGNAWRPLERTGAIIGADVPSNKEQKGF